MSATLDPRVEERLFDAQEALAQALANDLATNLQAEVEARGVATLVCSGGTTPGAVYDRLATIAIDWARVIVTGSDERWVPGDDPASLERLVAERLRHGHATAARWVSLYAPGATPVEAEAEIETRLRALPRPFTAVMLGMGLDGHTASLFPGAPQLARALDPNDPASVRGIGPIAGAAGAAWRMTLTLRALLDTRRVIVLIRGDDKLAVYRRAMAGSDDGLGLPIAAVVHQSRAPVTLYWAP